MRIGKYMISLKTWYMVTSSNGTKNALLALCAGNSPVTGKIPSQKPMKWSLIFFLSCARWTGWVNNQDAGDSRRHRDHNVTVIHWQFSFLSFTYGGLAYVLKDMSEYCVVHTVSNKCWLSITCICNICASDLWMLYPELNCYSISFNYSICSFVQIGIIIISKITSKLCICRHNFLHYRAWEYRVTDATSQQHPNNAQCGT